jgi:hypothetical protein
VRNVAETNGMGKKTTERRLKDELVVLEKTSPQYSSRETNPIMDQKVLFYGASSILLLETTMKEKHSTSCQIMRKEETKEGEHAVTAHMLLSLSFLIGQYENT